MNRKLTRFDRFRDRHQAQEDLFWILLLCAFAGYVGAAIWSMKP